MQNKTARRISVTFHQTIGVITQKSFKSPYSSIVLHVPHNGTVFPPAMKEWYEDHGINLLECARWLTDHYTADLFRSEEPRTRAVVFPISRIICDVERLLNDPLEERGLGITYDLSLVTGLKNAPRPQKESMMRLYSIHHNLLKSVMEKQSEPTLLLDCHSFSEHDNVLCPNAHEFKDIDICLGFNEDETKPSDGTLRFVADFFQERGYRVAFNKPFSNSMTVDTDHQYHSLMIEVNKHCYMNEDTLEITDGYYKLHKELQELYHNL